jgi:hypothetical protein
LLVLPRKSIGGGGREIALGLTFLEAPEEFAFGSSWDALGLQVKDKEQLLMIPQSNNVLSAASAIVMYKIKFLLDQKSSSSRTIRRDKVHQRS